MGESAAMFSVLPVAVAGWLLGQGVGVLAGLLNVPMNLLLFNVIEQPGWDLTASQWPWVLMGLVIGTGAGWVREMLDRAKAGEQRLADLFRDSPDPIIVLDLLGNFRFSNPAAERYSGYAPEEVIGRHFSQVGLLPPASLAKALQEFAFLVAGQIRPPVELEVVRKDGGRWIAECYPCLMREEGRITGLLVTIRDITEHKRVQTALQRRTAELEAANLELEAFSYSVSHDLRAPLRHLDGFTSLLKAHVASTLDEKGLRYLELIAESSQQMGRLTDSLLAFSRMGRTELRKSVVSLDQLIKEAVHELQPDLEGRHITWTIGALPEVEGDAALLRQVFINLIANAIKYTRPREQAHIEIGPAPGPAENGETTIFVRDNGVGFDMEHAHKLFGVFQRLHHADEFEGTGIGLAHVRRIIQRHGGQVWAEGAANRGATFYVSLPVGDREPQEPQRSSV